MKKVESISIIWDARKENLENITKKIVYSLTYIMDKYPQIYSKWYQLGNSIQESLEKEVLINEENIQNILKNNFSEKEADLGTRISLWNGKKEYEEQASFSAKVGGYSSYLSNNFILDFPKNSNFTIDDVKPVISNLKQVFEGKKIRINGNDIEFV